MSLKTLAAAAVFAAILIWPAQTIALLVVGAVLVIWCRPGRVVRYGEADGMTVEQLRSNNVIHEAGHYVIAKAHGAAGVDSVVRADGRGSTGWWPLKSQRSEAIAIAAGTEATNVILGQNKPTTRGDASLLPDVCRRAGITPDQARALARAEVQQRRRAIGRAAQRLDKRGRI